MLKFILKRKFKNFFYESSEFTVSYDETHSIWFSQREHGDVELLRSTVGSMDVKTALQIINQTQLFIVLSSRCAGPSFLVFK